MALIPLQQADPVRYKAWVESAQQPQAQLQETNAAAGAAGASAALSTQNTQNAQLEQPLRQSAANQLSIINQAGDYFQQHSDKNGYVSPQDYNNYLAKYTQQGGDSGIFNKTFQDKYVDPKNAFYDTPDAKAARSVLPVIKNVIDSYHNLTAAGPASGIEANLPLVGNLLQQGPLAAEKAHNDFLTGQIGNIRSIAGAGAGQGFRFNLTELNNIASLLPNAYDSHELANYKLGELNNFMKDNMGTDLNSLYGK